MTHVEQYLAAHGLDGVVRIPQDEYGGIPRDGYLAHFTLEITTVEAGKRYALPRILRHGYLHGGVEVLPKLSFDDSYFGECLEVRNRISYDALVQKDFEHSLRHIQSAESLKHYILERYRASKPDLTPHDILSRGVARILFRLSSRGTP